MERGNPSLKEKNERMIKVAKCVEEKKLWLVTQLLYKKLWIPIE